MCDLSENEYEGMPLKDETADSSKFAPESDNYSSESTDKLIKEGSISKNSVELIKNISEVLENGTHTSINITINDIKGDNYNDGATNSSAGHDNSYNDSVCIGTAQTVIGETAAEHVVLNLSDYSAVYQYLKEQQQNPYCSLLIVLSIFDNSQFDLVSQEAKIFYDLIVEEYKEIVNDKGEKFAIKREPFEISRQEACNKFGVKFYQDMLITSGGRLWTSFIGFSSEEHSLNILRCVYSEFVTLKDKVTAFLTKLICSEKITLYVAAINTLKKLCDINPEYFISKIVVRLIQNKSIPSDIAVAQVLCSIAENSKSEYRADKYLAFVPNIDKDIHYYIITLLMCKTLSYKRDKIGKLIRPILWELITQPSLQLILDKLDMDLPEEENFINNIDLFFNIGNRYAEYYIALVSEICNILKQMKRNDPRRDFAQFITLLFIQEDYNESCLNTSNPLKFKDMIFIRLVLRDSDTSNNLIFLWTELLRNRRFKRISEKILENYLILRSGFVSEEIEYLKIETFFSKLAKEERIRNNIMFFLMNISTRPQNPISLAGKYIEKLEVTEMANMNPIIKNEPYKYSWLDKPPVVPNDMALVLYPHDSREHCNVYLQEDTVFPEAIKKWHLDRLVHITLQAFEFQHSFRFSFANGTNQWVNIIYKFIVSVKPDRDAIKVILKNNVTDISEPILEYLDAFTLDKPYKSLELSILETDALQKIRELLSRLTYLKIQVNQVASSVDDVSQKQIDDDKADKLRQADVEALKRKLARDKEEAEARRKEAEVAIEKAETEKQLAEIRHQAELEEQQHNIDMKTKEVAAQKAYQLQQAENVAAVAQAQLQNIEMYGLENLAAIDSTYQGHINSQQAKIDLERENKMKDLELVKQKISLIKEMAEAGVIDDMTVGEMTKQLLLGGTQAPASQISSSSPTVSIEDKNVINISEDGKDDI